MGMLWYQNIYVSSPAMFLEDLQPACTLYPCDAILFQYPAIAHENPVVAKTLVHLPC